DGAREDDRRLTCRADRGAVGGMHLRWIVSTERELLQLLVRQMADHLRELRILAPEVLADVRARFDRVLLILAIDDLAHPLDEQSIAILREDRIPLAAPQRFVHVPARAAERRFELLDDLTVAADGTVEPLEVAVDDEDQVVEFFARGQRDRAERFGFVGLAVAEERPHLSVRLLRCLCQAAILEVAYEARLI